MQFPNGAMLFILIRGEIDMVKNGGENPSFRRKISSRDIRGARLAEIRGFEVRPGLSVGSLVSSYATLGFQASHLAQAAAIIRKMRREKATVFLSFTSNMVSSGL